jgi:4-amino-4-deoxy-L-arabinose transferase-like glycosyltransferase
MFPRLSLGQRALTLFSPPDVVLMTLFVAVQVALLAFAGWPDAQPAEASALAQAERIARGDGLGAALGGLSHLAGAPLWAALAGVGALAGGLVGARVIAILCLAGAGVAIARAARNLFGGVAGIFTAALFALSGPLLFIAHLATPDHLALLGVAVSLWAITQASKTRRDEWLLLAGVAFAIAVVAQVAALPLIVPLGLVMLTRREQPTSLLYAILSLCVLALLVSRFAPPPVAVLAILPRRGPTGLRLHALISAAGLQLVALNALAWGGALAGWMSAVARDQGRLAAALFAGLLFGPVIAALSGGALDALQWTVPSLLFGLPLMGLAFATLWLGGERLRVARQALAVALLLLVGGVGLLQARGLGAPGALRPAHGIHFFWGRGAYTTPHTTPPRAHDTPANDAATR